MVTQNSIYNMAEIPQRAMIFYKLASYVFSDRYDFIFTLHLVSQYFKVSLVKCFRHICPVMNLM